MCANLGVSSSSHKVIVGTPPSGAHVILITSQTLPPVTQYMKLGIRSLTHEPLANIFNVETSSVILPNLNFTYSKTQYNFVFL